MASIKINALQDTVQRMLRDFGEEAEDALEEVAKEVAKGARRTLRLVSPKGSSKEKKYYAGWKYRVDRSRMGLTSVRVFNDYKPGLTHLLEHGHVTKNGTKRTYPNTPAYPHIAKVDEKVQYDFIDKIQQKLGI